MSLSGWTPRRTGSFQSAASLLSKTGAGWLYSEAKTVLTLKQLTALLIVLVALSGLAAGPASAHEIENTHVLVTFSPDGRYQIDILNDADWIWLRLTGGQDPLPPMAERDQQLGGLTQRVAEAVTMTFDGVPVDTFAVEYVPPVTGHLPDTVGWAEPGVMRVTGETPSNARTFQFAYELIEDPYPLTIAPLIGEPVTRWVTAWELSEPLAIGLIVPMTRAEVTRQYLGLGFLHILPRGLDHILFVVGLFLLSPKLKPLLMQVTAFTLAHTITLGLTIYGVVSLPPRIVEPLIALSIAYVAVENLVTTQLRPWRIALVFGFGLLHGMGFAGVLGALGLPRSEFLTALVTFNIGVETGQLTVLASVFVAVAGIVKKEWYRRRVAIPLSLAIAAVGLFWTVQRLFTS